MLNFYTYHLNLTIATNALPGIFSHEWIYWTVLVSGWVALIGVVIVLLVKKGFSQNRKLERIFDQQQQEIEFLKHELELLATLTSETDNLVSVTDKTGKIIYANRSLKRTLGLIDDADIKGKNLFDLEGFNKIYDIFQDSTERRQNAQTELFLTNKKGQRYWLQISFSHTISESIHKVVVIATNINDLKYAEEEISQQREELMVQSEQLEAMNTELEHVNQLTTDSINYAQRIQFAILPRREDYMKHIADSFVMFRPRDIVSGDFFWYGEIDNKAFFVEADCTGHGVPGALMATIGNTLLNEIVISERIFNPAIVLKELNKKIKLVLRQESGLPEQQDGMDMSFVQYDYENKEISISLANQFAYIKQNEGIKEIEGSLFAIGGSDMQESKPAFDLHRYKLKAGDIIYLFSDGYRDQFNEDESEKMMRDRFRNILEQASTTEMKGQKEYLEEQFDYWRGGARQIDDVLVWGIQF